MPVKSARLLPDSDRGQLGSGDGDEAAERRTEWKAVVRMTSTSRGSSPAAAAKADP